MNTARSVAVASVVTPNVRSRSLNQTTSSASDASPDAKKRTYANATAPERARIGGFYADVRNSLASGLLVSFTEVMEMETLTEVTRVTADEVKQRMDRGEPFTFLDARNPQPWGEATDK